MPDYQPTSEKRCSGPFRALLRWAMFLFPLLWLTACAGPAQTLPIRPEPPPPSLAAECSAGPDYPAGDTTLGELLEIMAQREAAAADCRARHRALVRAWPR